MDVSPQGMDFARHSYRPEITRVKMGPRGPRGPNNPSLSQTINYRVKKKETGKMSKFATFKKVVAYCGVAGATFAALRRGGWGSATSLIGGVALSSLLVDIKGHTEEARKVLKNAKESVKWETLNRLLAAYSVMVGSKTPTPTVWDRDVETMAELHEVMSECDGSLEELNKMLVSHENLSERDGIVLMYAVAGAVVNEMERLIVSGTVSAPILRVYLVMLAISIYRDENFDRAQAKLEALIYVLAARTDRKQLEVNARRMVAVSDKFTDIRGPFEIDAFGVLFDTMRSARLPRSDRLNGVSEEATGGFDEDVNEADFEAAEDFEVVDEPSTPIEDDEEEKVEKEVVVEEKKKKPKDPNDKYADEDYDERIRILKEEGKLKGVIIGRLKGTNTLIEQKPNGWWNFHYGVSLPMTLDEIAEEQWERY
ncbi:ORF17 [black bullhead herpesvirus]|uniref:ORF17 n=1 Tax=black bullhead herpesvirus TaxID=508441 RepID=A0A2H5AJF2_9VIRU|nr:ORF17 [black bullhead herpesvirus]AUG72272.1 ORF17 [black bullhead herpesvirus]